MKKVLAIALCAMLVVVHTSAQRRSALSFDAYEWDFGTVQAAAGAVCHTFTFKNTSKNDVKIGSVNPSCECIAAMVPDGVIAPGQTAEVMVAFHPAKSVGKSFRSVELLDVNGQTLGALSVKATVSDEGAVTQYPYQNPQLSFAERVENLLSLLTPEEKVGLMMNKSVSVDRLGIPSYNWWSEACHGVRQDGYTVFPQPIGMAAAFNPQQVYDVFSAVSDEARANWNRTDHHDPKLYNVPMGVTYYPGNPELTFWCPNVNIFRDPRWGRGQETCGEDPYLTAILGVETVRGMQQPRGSYFKTHACAKHYAVHSGPEPLRHTYNASVSMRDLWETYLPAFKALVKKGNVREVMCAYNRYEGRPCCTSDRLLVDILRRKWNYEAIVLTDCDAINNFYNRGQHETHPDALSASVDAVLNGTDLECGKVFMVLTEALEKGLIQERTLDFHLRKTLLGRFELGMFDPAETLPWADLKPAVISSEAHNDLATQAARESIVLLENKRLPNPSAGGTLTPVLPLSKSLRHIAVVGPNADNVELLNGNYGGTPTKAHQHSLLEGIRNAVPGADVVYRKACELAIGDSTDLSTFDDLAQEVRDADVIIIIGGISARMEGEGGDKANIELPAVQQKLVRAMHATGRPVVFVNCSGSAIAFGSVEGCYDALLQAWYPGQGGAQALADVLFGDYNPSGKLPVTFYRSNDDLPDFLDYSMENRTYRYFKGEPQYAFGYGLSYTTFAYGKGKLSKTSMKADGKVTLTVPVTNTGSREGTEAVQVYVKALDYPEAPIKSLKGFQKLTLAAGQSARASITLDGEAFEYYDPSIDELSTRPGHYQILYGSSSREQDLQKLDFVVRPAR